MHSTWKFVTIMTKKHKNEPQFKSYVSRSHINGSPYIQYEQISPHIYIIDNNSSLQSIFVFSVSKKFVKTKKKNIQSLDFIDVKLGVGGHRAEKVEKK